MTTGGPFEPQQPSPQFQQPFAGQQPSYQPQPLPQHFPQPQKKRSKLPWILGGGCLVLVALVALVLIVTLTSLSMSAGSSPTTGNSTSSSHSSGVWKTLETFSGSGNKKTALFSVPGDWKITYTCTPMTIGGTTADGSLLVSVFGNDGSIVDAAAVNATCTKKTTDTTEEHQPGQVYLDIAGDSPWTVTITGQS